MVEEKRRGDLEALELDSIGANWYVLLHQEKWTHVAHPEELVPPVIASVVAK